MERLENLLNQVTIIQKKYDDLAEYSGEHYNMFDILGVRNSELSHSAILTNLLDAKGRHGQKDVFLRLFLEQIKNRFENLEYNNYIKDFETEKATAQKEVHIGGVNLDTAEGGRVDIVIKSVNKNIIIENKIYASDQNQQLLRYNNHYKNHPIIYLTLEGNPPSPDSKGSLILGKDFICCSYKEDIKNWLEKCIKEMVNKPFIRETLNQYLFLIRSLTNQSNNNKMSEEIIKLITNSSGSLNASKLISESYQQALCALKAEEVNKLIRILVVNEFKKEDISIKRSVQLSGFFLTLKTFDLKENGLFDFGINVDLDLNYYFFCVIKKDKDKIDKNNTDSKFFEIKEYLHSRIDGLISTDISIGYSKNWTIGINPNEYYLPNIDNTESYNELVIKIKTYRDLLIETTINSYTLCT